MDRQAFVTRMDALLTRVPTLNVVSKGTDSLRHRKLGAFELEVQNEGSRQKLLVEIRNPGTPSLLRTAIASLQTTIQKTTSSHVYGIVAAPYVSEIGFQLCRQAGVGCFDLAGNCLLNFGSVYIEVAGKPNPSPSSEMPSLFSPKSSRIPRVLLSNFSRRWQVQELAMEAGVSLGLASRIKEALVEEGYIVQEARRLKLVSPSQLLEAWAHVYSFKKNEILECYSLLDIPKLEAELHAFCERNKIRSAFTLFSGSARVAPYVRINKAFLYVEESLDRFVKALDLKLGISGSNLMLLRPHDEGVFYNTQHIESFPVVSDLQLYLDLRSFKGRGVEAADFLFQQKIAPLWKQSEQNETAQSKPHGLSTPFTPD